MNQPSPKGNLLSGDATRVDFFIIFSAKIYCIFYLLKYNIFEDRDRNDLVGIPSFFYFFICCITVSSSLRTYRLLIY